jgi:hypothetical protein
MSEIKKKLLEPAVKKKQVIGVILVAVILVAIFSFSVYFFSLILGTQREEPSDELEKASYEDAKTLDKYYPFDLLKELDLTLQDLLDLGLTQEDIDAIEDVLEEMHDGQIDNLDLTKYGLAIAALLLSDAEAFRVYDYDNPVDDRDDLLWRYECFDQFNRDGWESTVPKSIIPYYSYADYVSDYSFLDLIKIKRGITSNPGLTSLVISSIFSDYNDLFEDDPPYIVRESFIAPSLDMDSSLLFLDDMECTTADLFFDAGDDINMTYELFGENPPSDDDINSTAENAIYTPQTIKDQYLQLPLPLNRYITDNIFFEEQWNLLNSTIDINDNAFVVANKIRNHLQNSSIFTVGADELIDDGPVDGEDAVWWFCEEKEGLWSEFASAFTIFCRTFGVSARFVDGFNSRNIEEIWDSEEGKWTYQIKYRNIYNWAEIFVPTDQFGNGDWVQMDILYESYGGGSPISDFDISVWANASNFIRGETVRLTSKLYNTTQGQNVDGRTITFNDETTGANLGSNDTNVNGITFVDVLIDGNHIVGPNIISAAYQTSENYTYYIIDDEIRVDLNDLGETEINVSQSPAQIQVFGYVRDNLTDDGIQYALVNFTLLNKYTMEKAINPFVDSDTYTDVNGYFNMWLDFRDYIPYGEYYLRADFNGTWDPIGPYYFVYTPINDSSDLKAINVTKELSYSLLFSINGTATDYPSDPVPASLIEVKRSDQLNLTAIVLDAVLGTPISGTVVDFYDYTNGDVLVGSDISDSNGSASFIYTIGDINNKSGPTLVYAQAGGIKNYSYYIVNESIAIDVQSYSNPLEIDLAGVGPTQFNIICSLVDSYDNPIDYSQLDLRMNQSIFDYTGYITPTNPVFPTPVGSNTFDFNRGVISSTPIGNYTLRLEFSGLFDFTTYPSYPYYFDLPYFSNSTELARQLEVYDDNDVEIYLAVEGNPTTTLYDDSYKPEIYKRGEVAHFNVTVVHKGGLPAAGSNVSIWDDYSNPNQLLYRHYYDGSTGYVRFNISTNQFYYAGIHKIIVQFGDYPTVNTTFIILNETVNIDIDPTINTGGADNVVQRDNGGFSATGTIFDNGTDLRGLAIRLSLYNKTFDNVSHYLDGTPYGVTDANGDFIININSIDLTCPKGEYYVRIVFNGSIFLNEVPGIDFIWNYMTGNTSIFIPLNITAGSIINQIDWYSDLEFIDPSSWILGDVLHVIGNLTYDNSTFLVGMYVNVTVQLLDGTVIAYNDTVQTDGSGEFHALISVDGTWPSSRSDTKIVVYFEPNLYNVNHIENTNKTFV